MNWPHIHIRDKEELNDKVSQMTLTNTRVVSDFDATVTVHDGVTSWGFLKDIHELPREYHQESGELYNLFHPFESDRSIDPMRFNTIMGEWWELHLNLFEKYRLKRHHFNQIDISKLVFRRGFKEGLQAFEKHSIPTLILSAGISQTIEMALEAHNLMGTHLSVTANRPIFDDSGSYIGIDPPGYIHAGNKDEQHASREAQKTYVDRTHIILFGDNISDLRMIQPHERDNTVAVGFCSPKKPHMHDGYREAFDIVVSSDNSDLDVIAELMRKITK